ncbi:GntR-family transcriptional regulator [Bifidobacterium saguini DSM 23967]|uniref:GntR-family transcriptional regulator n=2 Tax=Bifidobacterium saguini TaxID=762210 RepID=A0A087D869_9BIFI|nr:FCD domain-containing protein [Bifidobacterium saguini]KFI91719.1 GntR-family transcriptional regulator [Bifidobacterium saguini DSM 23967]QTB89936.1 FadR family transcriptional regulator [Bifidobacterium saguini]
MTSATSPNTAATGATTADNAGNTAELSLHDRLLDEWGMAVVSGAVATGERLPEPNMDGDVTPSRTVTREVTRVLESMGLVSVKRKAGATANPIEQWNILDPQVIQWRLRGPHRISALHELSQLRAAVEPVAARLSASHATAEHWATLTRAAIEMVAHSDHADEAEYLEADILFHRTLLEASGNLMFAALGDVIASTLTGRTQHELMPKVADQTALSWHTEVAALIRKGDGAAAEATMRQIVDESDQAISHIAGNSEQ